MIFEDQYGVGDVIDTGLAKGTVIEVGLRVTKLRDVDGSGCKSLARPGRNTRAFFAVSRGPQCTPLAKTRGA